MAPKSTNDKILITGASGQLGGYLLREALRRGLAVVAWSGSKTGSLFGYPLTPVPLEDQDLVAETFRELRPTVVIHAAALASVAECAKNPDRAILVNCNLVTILSQICSETGVRLIQLSTDLVFDGSRPPYQEEASVSPLSVYGRTKADAELAALESPRSCVLRLSQMFGPTIVDRPVFFDHLLDALLTRKPFASLFTDEFRTPLSLATAARAILDLLQVEYTGILHLGGFERLSRYAFGARLARFLQVPESLIVSASRQEGSPPEPRPADVSLDSRRFYRLLPDFKFPTLEEAFAELDFHRSKRPHAS